MSRQVPYSTNINEYEPSSTMERTFIPPYTLRISLSIELHRVTPASPISNILYRDYQLPNETIMKTTDTKHFPVSALQQL